MPCQRGEAYTQEERGPLCRNDLYATLVLQVVLVKAMPSQGRMKQQESLYEYRLMRSLLYVSSGLYHGW
ncbi:UNVERIFIED_CONTAM: hypothetical protein FKN15_014570 [Acipenser sinensis]